MKEVAVVVPKKEVEGVGQILLEVVVEPRYSRLVDPMAE